MIVLDTNVLSELMRTNPSVSVVRWVSAQPATSLYTTAVSEAEILFGLSLVAPGKRRHALEAAARAMFELDFSGRILAFERNAARSFAEIAAHRRRAGRPISQYDAQIAAIARATGGALATRNVDDFDDCGIDVINPFS